MASQFVEREPEDEQQAAGELLHSLLYRWGNYVRNNDTPNVLKFINVDCLAFTLGIGLDSWCLHTPYSQCLHTPPHSLFAAHLHFSPPCPCPQCLRPCPQGSRDAAHGRSGKAHRVLGRCHGRGGARCRPRRRQSEARTPYLLTAPLISKLHLLSCTASLTSHCPLYSGICI
jgi:hypothetical protein